MASRPVGVCRSRSAPRFCCRMSSYVGDGIVALDCTQLVRARQVVHRARERVRGERKRFDVAESAKAALSRNSFSAMEARDEKTLLELVRARRHLDRRRRG